VIVKHNPPDLAAQSEVAQHWLRGLLPVHEVTCAVGVTQAPGPLAPKRAQVAPFVQSPPD